MIGRALRWVVNALASVWAAVVTLTFALLWSAVGTAIPQGAATARTVTEWDKARPVLAAVVNALGLHHAFTAWPFLACVALLGLSTIVCSWRRTRAAYARARVVAGARTIGRGEIAASHDLAIAIDPALPDPESLARARDALSGVGIRTKERDGVLSAVSPAWSVWGSAVFHWSLVALMLVILVGNLQRSDGLMAVSVGETKPDAASSYGVLTTGPLHSWANVHRSFRVDALAPDMVIDGVDRGAVPTVSVLDANGNVLKTQLVYPNMMLHLGSLAINCPDVGLSANLSLISPSGQVVASTFEPIDFSENTSDGTSPVGLLAISSASSGKVKLRIGVTIPLDRVGSSFGAWLPKDPRANVTLYDASGVVVGRQLVHPGESVDLPGGGAIRLNDLGWYARLSIVDDWTTPYIYAAMILALLALSVTLIMRQQIVVASVMDGESGRELALKMRLWRNVPATRAEIESALREAVGGRPPVDAGADGAASAGMHEAGALPQAGGSGRKANDGEERDS